MSTSALEATMGGLIIETMPSIIFLETQSSQPTPTLENLAPELIVNILNYVPSISDLHALMAASPNCYRLTNRYNTSIYTAVAETYHGTTAWSEASKVLVHQRHLNASRPFTTLKKDLATPFVLQKTDIPQLIANQRFFDICSFGRSEAPDFTLMKFSKESILASDDLFVHGDTLPVGLFYKMWLMHFRFLHDSIITWASRPACSVKRYADLHLVACIMQMNTKWACELVKKSLQGGLFRPRWREIAYNLYRLDDCYSVLYMKVMLHFRLNGGEGYHKDNTIGILSGPYIYPMEMDLKARGVESVVKKFKLDEGW